MTSRRLLDPAATALLAAADYIEHNGHCKGSYYKGHSTDQPPPPACTIGALLQVTSFGDIRERAGAMLAAHLGTRDIPDWNDAPERTAADVTAAFRSAVFVSIPNESKEP